MTNDRIKEINREIKQLESEKKKIKKEEDIKKLQSQEWQKLKKLIEANVDGDLESFLEYDGNLHNAFERLISIHYPSLPPKYDMEEFIEEQLKPLIEERDNLKLIIDWFQENKEIIIDGYINKQPKSRRKE